MVLLRVAMRGSGTKDDPFTVPLPNFAMISADYAAGTCIVEIPNKWFPQAAGKVGVTTTQLPDGRQVITGIRPSDRQTVTDFLDQNYPDYAGVFRPQLA